MGISPGIPQLEKLLGYQFLGEFIALYRGTLARNSLANVVIFGY